MIQPTAKVSHNLGRGNPTGDTILYGFYGGSGSYKYYGFNGLEVTCINMPQDVSKRIAYGELVAIADKVNVEALAKHNALMVEWDKIWKRKPITSLSNLVVPCDGLP
ncbi:MAG: hypothetical protein PF495_12730 [Spirochaetales bacterium]|jgi:hypothetical protein|nr:hypothetical protein [Spirochaetales bacterium]